VTGTLENYQAQLKSTLNWEQQALQVSADSTGSLSQLQIESLQVEGFQGRLDATGMVNWQASPMQYQLDADWQNIVLPENLAQRVIKLEQGQIQLDGNPETLQLSTKADLIIDDIRSELRGRAYELVAVAGGWQFRTRTGFATAIRAATGLGDESQALSQSDALVLMCIAYFQPITRGELSVFFGKDVSRDVIGHLRSLGFIAAGPRSPTPGAPYTYVTTPSFLSHFGFDTLRDLPDMEALEDAGLLSKEKLMAGDIPVAGRFMRDDDEID